MASGSKPRWRDRFRGWKPSLSTSPHKTGQAALKSVLGALQSSLGQLPPLQVAIGGLIECITNLEIAEKNRHAYEGIMSDLTTLASLLQKHIVESNPRHVPYSVENIARAISEQTDYIKQQQDRSQISRLALAKEDEEAVLGCYRRADVSLSIWDAIREQQMDTRLKDLLPAHDAYYNAAHSTAATKRLGCTKNTRVEILKAIFEWARGADVPPIYWMNGMAGTGKTTIAYTICEVLQEYRQLGGSFFCSRNSPDCRNVNKIVPTIAYQLGRYSKLYRKALCDVLDSNPDVAKRDTKTQFEQLISKPLRVMGKEMPHNVVVVIDALDECNDVGGIKAVLNLLLQCAADLPIRFFVTSRPEPTISNRMAAPGGAVRSILRLHDIEQSLVQADIKTYLTEALEPIEATPLEIDQLAARAGSLFIFAATAVRYVLPDMDAVDHRQRLQTVLKMRSNQRSKTYQDIDELYATILSNALDEKRLEQVELDGRRQALWTVVCAREPLTIMALGEILGLRDDRAIRLAIQPLLSVLHVSENTNVVSTLHASFPDFLLDKERAGQFYCDEARQSAFLAECCFRVMERSLRFNICGLESSYQLDGEVLDLQNRIDSAVSAGLIYSCIYWGDHLIRGPSSDPLLLLLDSFMRHRLLFWLEVLNLKGGLGYGDGALGKALAWLLLGDGTNELRNSIHDARGFLFTLASSPVSLSTPHIYISTLPFTSRQSYVWANYWPKTRGLLSVSGAELETSRKPVLATWTLGGVFLTAGIAQSSNGKLVASGSKGWRQEGPRLEPHGEIRIWDTSSGACVLGPLWIHEPEVVAKSVAFSPDATRLASGFSDGAICIWDASKGNLVTSPLRSHASGINSVAFSSDGTRLASGSDDGTIRLWDAYTGASLSEPFHEHRGAVRSISFSPDGKHLASGSSDGTIRVWDSWAGSTVQGPIEGHTDAVHSISYSQDGLQLVSGSGDCTIRVWDMSSCSLLAGPFEGHTAAVNSVSFSPDRTQVVSGSDDKTVRVWEAVSGRLVAGPLEGHSESISSVFFSVDGTRILSGSQDNTIRVWDPRHGTTSAAKSEGHTTSINSISLSPDGTRVASGSSDNTICVWDAYNGTLVAGPLRGHAGAVCSVAFSPDGARIVSGSWDCTLRVWDASTGALLVGPIEGHTGSVRSVTFSPDGSQIASGSGDGTIRLWDSCSGELVAEPFKKCSGCILSVAFSPEGSRIVSSFILFYFPDNDFDNALDALDALVVGSTVRMWLTSDGAALWESNVHTDRVKCVAFSHNGTRVVSSWGDATILVLNARDGAVLHAYGPFTGYTRDVTSTAFSPDGTRGVSGSWDRAVRMWDVESGATVVGPLRGHTEMVGSVAFSFDGARIFSGSDDGTIRIWDVAAAAQASSTSSDDWSIDEDDGWLSNSESQRLLWVPYELRRRFGFLTPSNPVVINADCTIRIDDTTLLGDRWHECYVASPDSASS